MSGKRFFTSSFLFFAARDWSLTWSKFFFQIFCQEWFNAILLYSRTQRVKVLYNMFMFTSVSVRWCSSRHWNMKHYQLLIIVLGFKQQLSPLKIIHFCVAVKRSPPIKRIGKYLLFNVSFKVLNRLDHSPIKSVLKLGLPWVK